MAKQKIHQFKESGAFSGGMALCAECGWGNNLMLHFHEFRKDPEDGTCLDCWTPLDSEYHKEVSDA